MAITINPIVPDEDEEPRSKKRSESSSKSDRSSSGSSARSTREQTPSRRQKDEESKSNAEKEEIADKMKMRYGLDEFKYTELPSKANTGKRNHRTGGRKSG